MLGAVFLGFGVGLIWVKDLVEQRQRYRAEALASIQDGVGGAQRVIGPLVAIPWSRTVVQRRPDGMNEEVREDHVLVVAPRTLEIEGHLATQTRSRGIFETEVFTSRQSMRASFSVGPDILRAIPTTAAVGTPVLWVSVTEPRGIIGSPAVTWQGRPVATEPGLGSSTAAGDASQSVPGFSAPIVLPFSPTSVEVDARVELTLQGSERLEWVPLADAATVTLSGTWPHPSFQGAFLPMERHVSRQGFDSRWEVGRLATGLAKLRDVRVSDVVAELNQKAFGVSLVAPFDVYGLSIRATKYGLLFVLLTFGAFQLFEVLGKARLHAAQYGLVAAAQSVFFLLLLSLAEHVRFALAYAVAATACVALIGAYLAQALKSSRRAAAFSVQLTALYGAVYVLLLSEDHALLLGSVLIFTALGAVMMSTRKLNWFDLPRLQEPVGARIAPHAPPPL